MELTSENLDCMDCRPLWRKTGMDVPEVRKRMDELMARHAARPMASRGTVKLEAE